MSEWKPSPQLLKIVSDALATFARHWPKHMRMAFDSSDAGRAFTADYGKALVGADMDAITMAVDRWMREENDYPPKPSELAKLARDITREIRPVPLRRFEPMPAMVGEKDAARINMLGLRAKERVGSWRLVGECWALLLSRTLHADTREASMNGKVPNDVWDSIIDSVLAGKRAPSGPLADVLGAA